MPARDGVRHEGEVHRPGDHKERDRYELRLDSGEAFPCDRVINCTGLDTNVQWWSDQLTKSLLARGVIKPDPLALGVCTTKRGEIIGGDGSRQRGVFTVGGLLRPIFWETTAVQELREQAITAAELGVEAVGGR